MGAQCSGWGRGVSTQCSVVADCGLAGGGGGGVTDWQYSSGDKHVHEVCCMQRAMTLLGAVHRACSLWPLGNWTSLFSGIKA